MNRIKRSITVRFFSMDATSEFFSGFESSYLTSVENSLSTRIFNIRLKKHLVKVSSIFNVGDTVAYPLTVVRERNTWQTKATKDGAITGISTNQGIIGDPYFFIVVPCKKVLLGFTTGPSVSLKSVGKTMLDQFNTDRKVGVKLDLIPKEKEFSKLVELPDYSSLHFKINSSSLIDVADNAPQIIKDLSAAPYIENDMQLSLDLIVDSESESSISKENVIEIVNYLSAHDGCSVLKVKGEDSNGGKVNLDFGNAFFNYKTEIQTRNKFMEEKLALDILDQALQNFNIEFTG